MVTVIYYGFTYRPAQVVRRYMELSGKDIELVVRRDSIGKTPAVREQCEKSNADAMLVLDADTVLTDRNYVSRMMESLFKNAGVASACGEVMPFTRSRRRSITRASSVLGAIESELGAEPERRPRRPPALLEFFTVMYRRALYVFLQRILYDGHMKMFGSRLNPIGCAVAYRTQRLRECFAFAGPQMGDNLSNSEDIFIGHFFVWKGWRNVQVAGVRCESIEPTVVRLPRQLYMWSSSFFQAIYYFKALPLSPFRQTKNWVAGLFSGKRKSAPTGDHGRRIQEQYREPWGEEYTLRSGRRMGWIDLLALLEKASYPIILLYLAIFSHTVFWITIGVEAAVATMGVLVVADSGTRWISAGMMLAATPIRILSLGVDLVATLRHLWDLATGNRDWRK
jgi:hypothetical protein